MSWHLADPPTHVLSTLPLTTPVPPLLGRAAMSSMRNPFRRARQENESGQIHITIKWGAHK